jgi:anaerobic magnesium-protoporphyrin IX monomethyl ester cyclase
LKILFVEPPKDFWFVMGEYLPPPLGILQIAAYLEQKNSYSKIRVIDSQAFSLDWGDLETEIKSFDPDIIAPSGLSTCNTYAAVRTLQIAKKNNSDVIVVVGGQHFTATAENSLETYPEIDIVVRGEGELTISDLVDKVSKKEPFHKLKGITFRNSDKIISNPPQTLINDLDELPYPAYHLVQNVIHKYHFIMMAGSDFNYLIVEGSRGCEYRCTFCSQWKHWNGHLRTKSAKRIADEMEFCYRKYGARFLWLADDHFPLDKRANNLCDELINRDINEEIMWFAQTRCDDVVKNKELIPKLRKAGNRWILMGAENNNLSTLKDFNKNINPNQTSIAVDSLKRNNIFSQLTFIIGTKEDSSDSIESLRKFADNVDPDLAIFMILTPFPGTKIYEEAKDRGVIQDSNWTNYDMIHAIMPTEKLSIKQLHEELYICYRSFYGSWKRKLAAIISPNILKRRTYRYLATQGLLNKIRGFF